MNYLTNISFFNFDQAAVIAGTLEEEKFASERADLADCFRAKSFLSLEKEKAVYGCILRKNRQSLASCFANIRLCLLYKKENQLVIVSDDEYKLKSVIDVLQSKLVRREVSLKALDYGTIEQAGGNTVRQIISIQKGIPQDKGKEIVKFLKTLGVKVQGQIMDDQVRVSGKNRDDLQVVISAVKAKDFDIAMNFINYR